MRGGGGPLLAALLGLTACGPELRTFGFLGAQTAALAPPAGGIAVADLDGDGRADLVTVEDDRLALRLGAADGSFAERRELPIAGTLSGAIRAVAAGDVNGDGRPDIVVLRALVTDRVQALLMGDGATPASTRETPLVGFSPVALALGDLDGDGRADLALGTAADRGQFSVRLLRSNGDGSFSPLPGMPAGPLTGEPRIALADVNGDRRRDLVRVTGDGPIALLGNGDGTFGAPYKILGGPTSGAIAAFDMNGDTVADVIGVGAATATAPEGRVSLALSQDDGTFLALGYPVGFGPSWVAAGDVDGDRRPDLIAASAGRVAVRRNASQ